MAKEAAQQFVSDHPDTKNFDKKAEKQEKKPEKKEVPKFSQVTNLKQSKSANVEID